MKIRLSATVAVALSLATLVSAPASADEAPAPDLVEVRTNESKMGTHTWYRQTFQGVPVIDGYYAVHEVERVDGEQTVDGRKAVPTDLAIESAVESSDALNRAESHLKQKAAKAKSSGPAKDRDLVPEFGDGEADLAIYKGKLVWDVISRSKSSGSTETFIDANSGAVLGNRTLSKNVDGVGRVFRPNPVQTLRNQNLRDNRNAPQYGTLNPAYVMVTLPRLNGDGSQLQGLWANVVAGQYNILAVPDVSSGVPKFKYFRDDGWFEETNAYFAVDRAQEYMQSIGFSGVYAINAEPQDLWINITSDDQSWYDPTDDSLNFGRGGVDDAEDMEVTWHEYGHALQDAQVPGFGTTEDSGAIGEGFGDYFAVTLSKPYGGSYDSPCVADWDATFYDSTAPHCLRRTDSKRTYWNWFGEVHQDGKIWSATLWAIHKALGRQLTDNLILNSQFYFTPDISMPDAAACMVEVADFFGYEYWQVQKKIDARHLDGGTCPVQL